MHVAAAIVAGVSSHTDEMLDVLDSVLAEQADPVRAAKEKEYLHSTSTHLGVGVPALHRIARSTAHGLDRETLLDLAVRLWDEPTPPVHERRFMAADLLANRPEIMSPSDVILIERMTREAGTWAIVDTLAPRVLGPMVEQHPDDMSAVLDAWARAGDRWLRRSVLLAYLPSLRAGRGNWHRFTGYADSLLDDREFFVAKAIGWVLRDTARKRPDLVLAWAEPRLPRMQRVTAREVVKPYPADVQKRLLSRHSGT
jgi:3-methyladenine DNA glycosylase AlkD